MNRRAATALRFLAVIYILSAIKTLVVGVLRDSTIAMLDRSASIESDSKPLDTDAIIARLHSINSISMWVLYALIGMMLVGFVMLAMSLEKERGLVGVAIGLLLAYAGVTLYEQFHTYREEPGSTQMLVWIVSSAAFSAAGMLPLIAAAREKAWEETSMIVAGALAFILIPTALDAAVIVGKMYSPKWQWAYRFVDIGYAGWFVTFALKTGRALVEGAPEPSVATGTLDPSPLRTIGWALLVRIGLGFVVAVAAIISTMHSSYDTLSSVAIGSTVVGVLTTLFLIGGLVGYSKYPAAQRSDGLYAVVGLLVIAVILEIVCAKTNVTFYGLLDKAQHADSMWSMPSISDIEGMQTTIAWTGRISMVLGLVSIIVLLGSLATTARSVGASDLARTAGVTMVFAIVATFGAIGVGAWMEHVKRGDESMLIIAALLLLALGIAAVANLLRVIFGTANAIERPTIPGAAPLPEARVVER